MEKRTIIIKSSGWTEDLLKKLKTPKLKVGDISYAYEMLGWDKEDVRK